MKDITFDDWFNEPEGFHLKSERFFETLSAFCQDSSKADQVTAWLQAAYYAGLSEGSRREIDNQVKTYLKMRGGV
jgi:hypothetical protein